MESVEIWQLKSNPVKQYGLLFVIFIIGVVLMVDFRDFDPSGVTESMVNFLLGVFLVGTTLLGVFASFQQSVTVDPNTRQIIIRNVGLKGVDEWIIPFASVTRVQVSSLKKNSQSIAGIYYLTLTLNDGNHSQLFFPAYFDGRGDESVANERRRRLEEYLQIAPSSTWSMASN